jgi:hypothetical protein
MSTMTEQILSDLRDAVLYFDPDEARRLAQKAWTAAWTPWWRWRRDWPGPSGR